MLNASQLRAALTALLMQLQLGLLRGNLRLPELRLHLGKLLLQRAAAAHQQPGSEPPASQQCEGKHR